MLQADHPGSGLTGTSLSVSEFPTTGDVGWMLVKLMVDTVVSKKGFKATYSVGGWSGQVRANQLERQSLANLKDNFCYLKLNKKLQATVKLVQKTKCS